MERFFSGAYELKNNGFDNIPEKAGYYKWWVKRDLLLEILEKLDLSIDELEHFFETQNELYCVYVGIACSESVKNRLKWHICDKHTLSNVQSRYLSTLRQSIAAMFGEDMLDQVVTDKIIDRMFVEYFLFDGPIGSENVNTLIQKIEKDMLAGNKWLYILNIHNNKHHLSPKKLLKRIRKSARNLALEKA